MKTGRHISMQSVLIGLGIFLFSFTVIWLVIIIPEITKLPVNFYDYEEQIGQNSLAPSYGANLPSSFTHFNKHELKTINATNDVLTISSHLQATNTDTGVKFLDESKIYKVNRYTRANTARDMGYFLFPPNTQQHDYFLTFPFGFTNAVFSYQGKDVVDGLEVYRFNCKSQPYNITNAIPQFKPFTVLSFYTCVVWVEPVTGNHVDFLLQWESYFSQNGKLTYLAEKGFKRTTPETSASLVDKTKSEKTYFQTIENIVPIIFIIGGITSLSFAYIIFSRKTKQLEMTNIGLRAAEKAKSEFISTISHEIRNPLQKIILYSEAFLGEKITSEQKIKLETIYSSAFKVDTLINDILDMQKIELGRMKMNPTSVDISDLVNENIKEMQLLSNAKNIDVQSDLKYFGMVYCDKKRIDQVLTNLIKNSIDFVPEKGKIIVRVEKGHDSNVIFTVEDNGIGIPLEKADKLFQKFYQIDSSLTSMHEGTGLGLAICKGIVEQHGGNIWLDKTYSKGTAIKFTLPIGNMFTK